MLDPQVRALLLSLLPFLAAPASPTMAPTSANARYHVACVSSLALCPSLLCVHPPNPRHHCTTTTPSHPTTSGHHTITTPTTEHCRPVRAITALCHVWVSAWVASAARGRLGVALPSPATSQQQTCSRPSPSTGPAAAVKPTTCSRQVCVCAGGVGKGARDPAWVQGNKGMDHIREVLL